MSYNNLHSYWSSRHRNDMAESSICQKREKEEQRRQNLEENFEYHRQCDLSAARHSAFEDGRPASAYNRRNQESLTEELAKETKEEKLVLRRQRLAELLLSEEEALKQEAKEKFDLERQEDPWNTKTLKEKLEILKKEKEAQDLQLSEKKLYQRRQINSFEAEKLRSQRDMKEMKEFWDQQIQQKQKDSNDEQMRCVRFEAERHREDEKQSRTDDVQRKLKEAEKKVWLEGLQLQIQELKDKELQESKLKDEEHKLLLYEQELERIKGEQKEVHETRKKKELSGILERQLKAKLRERAIEVQHQLEEDKKLLDTVFGKDNKMLVGELSKKEKLKSDVEWMKSIIAEQMKLEKGRQVEIELLYQEEAEKMWQKREAEWQREREARHKLMTEVLDGLKSQINEKVSRNRQEREKASAESVTVRTNVQFVDKQIEHERQETVARKEQYKQDLLKQMNDDQLRKVDDANRVEGPVDYDTKPLPGLRSQ